MKAMTAQEIARITGGRILSGNPDSVVKDVCTDSRQAGPGKLFVPIIGAKVDGHSFIPMAEQLGAAAVFSSRPESAQAADSGQETAYIAVRDTVEALQTLGGWYRIQYPLPLVGITGSAGKTTTKEMIAAALEVKYHVLKTEGNKNSQVGLPQMMLRLDDSHEIAVIEMGMSEPGEMARLAAIARPRMAVVTNIGVAHIGQLGTRENIRREKLDMIREFPDGGVLLVNGDDPLLAEIAAVRNQTGRWDSVNLSEEARAGLCRAVVRTYGTGKGMDYRASDIRSTPHGTRFTYTAAGGVREEIELSAFGIHNVYNALAALAVAEKFGIPASDAKEGLRAWRPSKMRGTIEVLGGVTLVDDTYNANPDSMKGAIDLLADLTGVTRRIAVLADMLELGELSEGCHREIGEYIVSKKEGAPDLVVLIGREAYHIAEAIKEKEGRQEVRYFTENAQAADYLRQTVRPGDAVVIKGSRSMRLDEIAEALRRNVHGNGVS